ncbi:MAG: serine--tRNA ligase [Defluviitaleaceae bacterium]|nr:serine--tRNA ligase [Defluviitaleaceae bacterium]
MQDIKALRENFEGVKNLLARRGKDFELDKFVEMDKRRRALLQQSEEMKAKQNAASKQIPALKKEGKESAPLMAEMKTLSEEIKGLEPQVRAIDEELDNFLLGIPNTPNPNTPIGESDEENVEIRRWSEPIMFTFEAKPHWEIGEDLGIINAAAAAKVTGSRFVMMYGLGARLERALINFMMERHANHGYVELSTPIIVHRRSALGTGQLPKFEDEMMYKLENTEYFLNSTAEIPVTNYHREEIIDGEQLPINYCSWAVSFRKEGGSAGRDTRGLIRQHQFHKVELVKFTKPEESDAELEKLTADAEDILQKLGLPYRVVDRCTGDLGFSAAKGYDLEVWLPSYNKYVEISSCSNFEGFQARRADIRYRDGQGKPVHVHTLNGSGLAIGRTIAAILENYQQEDGSVVIPEALVPYMGGVSKIVKTM